MQIKKARDINHKLPAGSKNDYPYALSDKIFHTKQLFLYSEKVRPGTCASAPHTHTAIDEIIYVVSGSLVVVEGDEEKELSKGDSVCFQSGSEDKHYLENRSSIDAEFLIFRRSTQKNDVHY